MQIHISWKALLAGLILIIGLGLTLRTVAILVTADSPPAAVASQPPAATAASAPTAAVVAPAPTATMEPPTAAPASATVTPPPTAAATATPTATASPEPTAPPASPTPFQPPTREPTPVPAALVIVNQGFGQRLGALSYAFVIENPNPALLAQDIRYQVAAYDAAGIVLSTDTDTIAAVGPGQRMGMAKQLPISQNLVVARVEVILRPTQFIQAPPLQLLEISNAAFVDGEPPNLTGILRNPLARDLADLDVIGIAYDDFGIIGGGATILPFVPSNGQAPVGIPVVTSQQATRVEFFAAVSAGP